MVMNTLASVPALLTSPVKTWTLYFRTAIKFKLIILRLFTSLNICVFMVTILSDRDYDAILNGIREKRKKMINSTTFPNNQSTRIRVLQGEFALWPGLDVVIFACAESNTYLSRFELKNVALDLDIAFHMR